MTHSDHPFRRAPRLIVVLVLSAIAQAAAAWPLVPAESFFTNVADRLLQQQLGLRLTEVQVAPSNRYDSAVHRLFQVTANLYDATTTNEFPAVFRPLFRAASNGVFLAGFTNDASVSNLPSWLESNPYGVPMVVAARKGFPNFNEFTVRSDITVQRKLQVVRNAPASPGVPPVGTNQMYVVGISNYFGVEGWNSSQRRYPRAATLSASNWVALTLHNSLGLQTNAVTSQAAVTNLAANAWRGFPQFPSGLSNSFILSMSTNQIFLNNSVYQFGANTFANISTNDFETVPGFPLPQWLFTVSNRLVYVMSEGDRILDLVLLQDSHTVDLYRDLITADPYQSPAAAPPTVAQVWNTNRVGSTAAPTDGIKRQMDISLGNVPTGNSEWRSFAMTQTAAENDKAAAIDAFRIFCGLAKLSTNAVQTNLSLVMVAPFNPAAKTSVVKTWQANDPLVHFHVRDLQNGPATNQQFLKPTQTGTNMAPATPGRLNDVYSPWGGNPYLNDVGAAYDRSLADPGVYGNDDWSFPSNAPLAVSWIGRVHRGTPWQTIYLKADAAPANLWLAQQGDLRAHPTNDWRMAGLLASCFNTNDVRALTSINTTNEQTWTATFTGLTALTNTANEPFISDPPQYETNIIAAGDPQIPIIVAGIQRARAASRGSYFRDVADFLSVPELSSASPFLNLGEDQLRWGLTDEAYEILPAQLLARVRADPVVDAARRGDSIELRVTAFDGYAFRVEGSNDARRWTTVSEPHFSTNGVFTLSVPVVASPRFFRAVLP